MSKHTSATPRLPVANIQPFALLRARAKCEGHLYATKGEAWCAGARAGMRLAERLMAERRPLVAVAEPEPLAELFRDALRAALRRLIRWGRR